jgi:hypothetical protein
MPRPALPSAFCWSFAILLTISRFCLGAEPATSNDTCLSDYCLAYERAQAEQKLLLIHFQSEPPQPADAAFLDDTLRDAQVRRMLDRYVRVCLPLSKRVTVNGKSMRLVDHGTFRHMRGKPGLAIVDLAHPGQPYFRRTVSCLPFESPKYDAPPAWSTASLRVLLGLPPGTLTQRTLVYAVRCHAELPACTSGRGDAILSSAATSHSRHQASISLQGHHNWEARFQTLYAQLGGEPPTEVCAESWSGESLVTAAFGCVHSWRQSPEHWSAVRAAHPAYGFDIARGGNGVWYATGIFGG